MSDVPDNERDESREENPSWLNLVRRYVDSLKFGTVQITVHDSQVTEVIKAERTRLARSKASEKGQSTGLP